MPSMTMPTRLPNRNRNGSSRCGLSGSRRVNRLPRMLGCTNTGNPIAGHLQTRDRPELFDAPEYSYLYASLPSVTHPSGESKRVMFRFQDAKTQRDPELVCREIATHLRLENSLQTRAEVGGESRWDSGIRSLQGLVPRAGFAHPWGVKYGDPGALGRFERQAGSLSIRGSKPGRWNWNAAWRFPTRKSRATWEQR